MFPTIFQAFSINCRPPSQVAEWKLYLIQELCACSLENAVDQQVIFGCMIFDIQYIAVL